MLCPKCGGKSYVKSVKDKREFTWRSRKCKKCGYSFTTKEMTEDGWMWKQKYKELVKSLNRLLKNS